MSIDFKTGRGSIWSRSRSRPARVGLELLEGRALLNAVFPTAVEQYMVELINRARLDPAGEAARYGIDLNEGLAPGTLSIDPRQPVAVNLFLTDAARSHAQWMFDHGIARSLPHFENVEGTASGGTPRPGYFGPSDRAVTAGYSSGGLPGFENQAWVSGGGSTPTAAKTDSMHQLLFKDFTSSFEVVGRGHRKNMLNGALTEIGVGTLASGDALSVQDFASGGGSFLTGVAFRDSVKKDNFYTAGEGLGGITISATRTSDSAEFHTTTWEAGGYTLKLDNGTYNIVASGGALASPMNFDGVVINSANIKRDFILDGSVVIPATPADLTGTLTLAKPLAAMVPGDNITLNLTVTNTGGTAAPAFTLKLFRSTDNTLVTNSDTLLGAIESTKPVAGGKTAKFKFNLTIDDTWTLGDSFFIADIDTANTVTESSDANNAAPLAAPTVVWSAGNFSGRTNVKLILNDPNSVPTTITLKGAGRADVARVVEGFDIDMTGTTAASALTVASVATSRVHDVDSNDGVMKSIAATHSTLTGDIDVGAITKIQFDDVADNHQITIGANPVDAKPVAVTFVFDEVDELSITSAIAIKSYTATAHRDRDGTRDVITAPSIAAVAIKGAAARSILGVFEADLIATDPAVASPIGKVTVADFVRNAIIESVGSMGAVTVGGSENASFYAGRANGAPAFPDALAQLNDFSIKSFTVKGVFGVTPTFINTILAARTLTKVALLDVDTTNGGTKFGLVADTIGAFTTKPVLPALATLKKATLADDDATGDEADDFVIRVL
ncbi:MAG: hypothetical protein K8S99_17830 [Planctomycetes bacterium]|nr:hypothetical protein [Planctomycetota bacterium]